MKYLIALILVTTLSTSYAQRLTYNDLVYGLYHKIAETEDRMLGKQLTFNGSNKVFPEKEISEIKHSFTKINKKKRLFMFFCT